MEPTIITLDIEKTLLNPIVVDGQTISEIYLKILLLRPAIKRIVFITNELDRVIVYDGEAAYNAHKDDSQNTLIDALLAYIDANYPHA